MLNPEVGVAKNGGVHKGASKGGRTSRLPQDTMRTGTSAPPCYFVKKISTNIGPDFIESGENARSDQTEDFRVPFREADQVGGILCFLAGTP